MNSTADPFDYAARVIAGNIDEDVQRWLQRGFVTWANADASISLNAALRLPDSTGRYLKLQRDFHLAVAAQILREQWPGASTALLHRELHTFVTRGGWASWRSERDPPACADEIRRALFYVAKATNGDIPSLKTVDRAVGQILRQICPQTAPMIEVRRIQASRS